MTNKDRLSYIAGTIISNLENLDIQASVSCQSIVGLHKLCKISVISDAFEMLPHSERQSIVWRIIETNFQFTDQLKIASVMTLTSVELEQKRDNT